MPKEKLVKPTNPLVAGVQFFLLGAEGLAFCPARKQLHYLNTTATYIWCSLEEGLKPPEIALTLAGRFQIPIDQADRDVTEALNSWNSEGLTSLPSSKIGNAAAPACSFSTTISLSSCLHTFALPTQCNKRTRPQAEFSETAFEQGTDLANTAPPTCALHTRHYRIGQLNFLIRFGSVKAESKVHPALAHLLIQEGSEYADSTPAIVIAENARLFRIIYNGFEHDEAVSDSELVPLIYQIILTQAYHSSGCLAAFHAGAVGNDRECIILPGAPGSGKSTLTAALVNSGLDYLTDELVLLQPDGVLCPLPVGLGLKHGSWSLLSNTFPKLERLPVHQQPDGTEVRYLAPSSTQSSIARHTQSTLVFPQYQAGVQTQLTSLSSAQAFYRLAEAGYAVPGDLDPQVVSTLVDWINSQRCYLLQLDDLDSALSLVRELLE